MNTLSRLGVCALWVCALGGCPDQSNNAAPPAGLKVPLPAGWVVKSADEQWLRAGPTNGAVVLAVMRQSTGEMPAPEKVEAALNAERVNVIKKESERHFLGYEYVITGVEGSQAHGMVGFRQVATVVFRCASAVSATAEQVQQAYETCRGITQ